MVLRPSYIYDGKPFTWIDGQYIETERRDADGLLSDLHHDEVIKWKHFPRNWPFVREIHRSPVNFPHKGQWRGALMFSLIYVWINGWVNNREAGDLRRQHDHYDVIVMLLITRSVHLRSLLVKPPFICNTSKQYCFDWSDYGGNNLVRFWPIVRSPQKLHCWNRSNFTVHVSVTYLPRNSTVAFCMSYCWNTVRMSILTMICTLAMDVIALIRRQAAKVAHLIFKNRFECDRNSFFSHPNSLTNRYTVPHMSSWQVIKIIAISYSFAEKRIFHRIWIVVKKGTIWEFPSHASGI